MSNQDFLGQVALVTGGAGDIGAACCAELSSRGATVVAVDRVPRQGPPLDVLACDVTDEPQVQAVVAGVAERFGRIDVVVNCAGIEGDVASLEAYPAEMFRQVLEVNVMGTFLITKSVLALMRGQGTGSIVNLASMAGLLGSPNLSAYITSKHAVVGLTRATAAEIAGTSIRVNAVCPGAVSGRMISSIDHGRTELEAALAADLSARRRALPRYGEPAEVARVVAFLASSAASYVNGTIMQADGGRSAV